MNNQTIFNHKATLGTVLSQDYSISRLKATNKLLRKITVLMADEVGRVLQDLETNAFRNH